MTPYATVIIIWHQYKDPVLPPNVPSMPPRLIILLESPALQEYYISYSVVAAVVFHLVALSTLAGVLNLWRNWPERFYMWCNFILADILFSCFGACQTSCIYISVGRCFLWWQDCPQILQLRCRNFDSHISSRGCPSLANTPIEVSLIDWLISLTLLQSLLVMQSLCLRTCRETP